MSSTYYKLRANVICEDLSEVLGVMAVWAGKGDSEYGLSYSDPRLPTLGMRVMLPPHLAGDAAADLGATLGAAESYDAHRIALAVPRGGLDFIYADTFPHEADMDQLNGVDFEKGCYVGQEVIVRVLHRGHGRVARRLVGLTVNGPAAPPSGAPIEVQGKEIGSVTSSAISPALGKPIALAYLHRDFVTA